MPRRPNPVPSYLRHKSGQAFCRIRRADGSSVQVYLGPWDSQESRENYARAIGGHVPEPKRTGPAVVAPTAPPTVAEIVDRFLEHARIYYRRPDGTQTNEVKDFTLSVRPLLYLAAAIPAAEIRTSHLRKVRDLMVQGYEHPEHGPQTALSRKVVNQRVGRIKRVWRWAVEMEEVPESVFAALSLVKGLGEGRSEARETEAVTVVPWAVVEKTLPHLNPVVRAMVLLQWHTGCRPGEVCAIRADEIDRTGEVWLYQPRRHKMAYRNKPRVVAIGKAGQEVLMPFLGRSGFLFSPALAVEIINAEKRAKRKTPVQPSQQCRKKANPVRKPGARYEVQQFLKAVARAAARAGVEPWHPNQLRHSFATRVRAAHGPEAARVALGHAHVRTTEIYAEQNTALAIEVARNMG